MKQSPRILLWLGCSLCALTACVASFSIRAENRVLELELDGNGSCVELPPNIFNDLGIEVRR